MNQKSYFWVKSLFKEITTYGSIVYTNQDMVSAYMICIMICV